MKLYVANTTKQIQEFLYWAPEKKDIARQSIPALQQILIYKDTATKEDLMNIVAQHEMYGLKPVSEIDRSKGKDFIGLCYQFDIPIDLDRFMQAIEHNDAASKAQNVEVRKTSAAATDAIIEHMAREHGGNLTDLSIEVEEVSSTPRGISSTGTFKEVREVKKEGRRGRVSRHT